ncbi:MAG: hypothetical protein OQJ81_01260 [Melioribacteraceae bacterium]|nr:hypothetical protein [Melioribacteraceae bacterium]
MVKYIKKNLLTSLLVIILLVCNVVFVNLPLLNILSYETSTLNAVLLSLLSGFYWLHNFKRKSNKSLISQLLLFTALPLVILVVSTVFCQQCPLNEGIYFYLLLVLPSIVVSIAIASISETLTVKWKYLIYIILWLLVIFSFLPELYFNPQIYFYNPIFGYYPGVIYDQNIDISLHLIFYQIINMCISLLVIYFLHFKFNFRQKLKLVVIYGLTIFVIVSYFIKPLIGFSTNLSRIKSELKTEIETEHFNIIIPDTLSINQIKILEYEHEYYYQSIANLLNTVIDNKITSIIFDPGAQKKRLFGSENADVAKPWLDQIYINLDNYENSLKHEISHIFSANFAGGIFKVPSNFNPGLIEGFAMAVENDYNNLDIDYMAALAYKNDYDVSLSDLFTNYSFFANASSLSYIYAGSFFKFLAKNHGWQKCNDYYSGKEFKEVFGYEIIELEKEYKIYLSELEVKENQHQANYYFSRKPLIKLNCARATAKELKYAKSLFEEKKYEEASIKYIEIYEYSEVYSAIVGFIQSKIFLEDKVDAIVRLSEEMPKFEGTGSYYYLEFLLADLHALNGDSVSALNLYEKIIFQNPHPIYLRSAKVKKQLLSLGNLVLSEYMNNPKNKLNKIVELIRDDPNDYLLQTLSVLIENGEGNYAEMIDLIKNLTNSNNYGTETYFELSKLAYKNLDFLNAKEFGGLAYQNSELRNKSVIEDHLTKINWVSNNILSQ